MGGAVFTFLRKFHLGGLLILKDSALLEKKVEFKSSLMNNVTSLKSFNSYELSYSVTSRVVDPD
jgi:hypothetical protein